MSANINRQLRHAAGALAMIAATLAATQASAKEDDVASKAASMEDRGYGGIDEIIVTAQRREERLQNIPIAMSVISSEAIERQNITTAQDLQSVTPGMVVAGNVGTNGSNLFSIRGISAQPAIMGQATTVAIYLDGIYLPRSESAFFTFDDVERIEVLRGPQGTLYGRNATAGAINIITRAPGPDTRGAVDVSFGNYDHERVKGAISGAIDKDAGLYAGVSGTYDRTDGFFRNTITNHRIGDNESYTLHGTLRYAPVGKDLDVRLISDYSRSDYMIVFRNILLTTGGLLDVQHDALSESLSNSTVENYGVNLTATVGLTDEIKLTSVSGYRHLKSAVAYDGDATAGIPGLLPGGLLFNAMSDNISKFDTYSQELRATLSTARVDSIIGVNYYREEQDRVGKTALASPAFASLPYGPVNDGVIEAVAAYLNTKYKLTSQLAITGGLRFNHERRTAVADYTTNITLSGANEPGPVLRGKSSDDVLIPAAGLDFQWTPDVLLYAKFTKGYQAPGFNPLRAAPTDTALRFFDAERLNAYEVGFKSQFLDRRVTLNASAFHYDYKDLQVRSSFQIPIVIVNNAGKAKIDGFDVALDANLGAGFRFGGNAAYTNARYDQFCEPAFGPGVVANGAQACMLASGDAGYNRHGFRLSNAPEWTAFAELSYSKEIGSGRFDASVNHSYRSTAYFSANNEASNSTGDVNQVSARIAYTLPMGLQIYAYVKNLTDDIYLDNGLKANALLNSSNVSAPRTYGGGLRFQF